MPMRATTVRFSEDLWQLLDDEATRQGISAAQFVRDAAIVRLAFLAGRRGDAESEQSIETIAERAVRRQQNGRGGDTHPVEGGAVQIGRMLSQMRLRSWRRKGLMLSK